MRVEHQDHRGRGRQFEGQVKTNADQHKRSTFPRSGGFESIRSPRLGNRAKYPPDLDFD